MKDRLRQILEQKNVLEKESRNELYRKQSQWLYRIRGERAVFEASIRAVDRRLATARPQNYLTAPISCGMIVPIVLFDLALALYQWTCFSIYGVARIRRSDCISFDLRQAWVMEGMSRDAAVPPRDNARN